jgi:hypothetical protein
MLTFFGSKQKFCDGLSRRNFLKIGAFGAGLTLADMLRHRASATTTSGTPAATSQKAAIMIYLPGGPSHMDMYDLKPNAPVEYRGEFQPIATNVPGVQICEHMPMQARMWDKLACIRSIISVDEHSDSLVMTGFSENSNRVAHHPSFGAVVSRLTSNGTNVPPFVSLRGLTIGCEPGYLGVAHRAFQPNGQGLENLNWASGVNATQVEERQHLLSAFDDLRRDIDASGTMEGMDTFNTRAFDMVTSGAVRQALNLELEAPQSRARYGNGIEGFLQARRLVEAGVGCVTLAYGGWDTHGQNFMTLRNQLPNLDRGVANLVQDLCERGMDQDVSVIVWGEFGRTPRVNGGAGRDHWAPCMSCMIAGGGMNMGQAVGASSPRGEYPAQRPVSAQRVLATLYRAMGIDPSRTFLDGAGRPRYIVEDREPITELLG